MKDKQLAIIEYYGVDHQLRKLVEEVYELIDAIHEMRYSNLQPSDKMERMINHIKEEYTDVLNVLDQHRKYWNISLEEIEPIYKYKIDRTYERIGAENEELLRSATRTRSSKKQTKKS